MKDVLRKFRHHSIFLAISLLVCMYVLVTPFLFFVSGQAPSLLSVRVNGVPHKAVSVWVTSLPENNKKEAYYELYKGFYRGHSYISSVEINILKEDFSNLESVEVQSGETVQVFPKKNILDKFDISKTGSGDIVLKSSAPIDPVGSVVPMLKNCLTWPGDRVFLFNAWETYIFDGLAVIGAFVLWWFLTFSRWEFGRFGERHLAKIVIGASVGMFLISFFYVGRIYRMNDDLGFITSMRFGETVVFSGSSLGYVLSFLYRHVSTNIGWYGWVLYLANVVALLLVLLSTNKAIENRILCLAIDLITLGLFFYSFTELTFTISAILISGASLFSFICSLRYEGLGVFQVLGLGVLFALGYLIRIQSIMVVVLFFGLVSFYIFLRFGYFKRLYVWGKGLLFLLPLIIAVSVETLVIPQFSSEEHEEFLVHDRARKWLHGFDLSLSEDDLAMRSGWSKNDYAMFDNWMYFDEEKFSVERMGNVRDGAKSIPDSLTSFVYKAAKASISVIRQQGWVLIFCFLLVLIARVSAMNVVGFLGAILYFFVASVMMQIFLRFPAQLSYPLSLMFILFGYLLLFESTQVRMSHWRYRGILAIGVIFFVLCVGGGIRYKGELDEKKLSLLGSLDAVEKACNNDIIISHPLAICMQNYDPLFPPKLVVRAFKKVLFPEGWSVFSPTFYRKLESIGLECGHDLFVKLYTDPTFYYITDDYRANLILCYLQENFNSDVKIVERSEICPNLLVFKYGIPNDG